ncbi:MAG: ligand-binding sensor domain-containing protein [Flavobacteriaceae bacterium]|jgi:ligand-binding sensor domain-containing protein
MRILISLLLFLLVYNSADAQKYAFTTYSSEEGLPQSQVTAICQDKDGYLWVSTLGGLAKFNGSEFTTFSSNDGLLNNRVQTLAFFQNTLWVGHDGGISYIKNNTIVSASFTGNDKSREVSKIIEFKDKVIICTNGGGLWELKNKKLIKIELKTNQFRKVKDAYAHNGVLYLATVGGILTSQDGSKFSVFPELDTLNYSGVTGRGDLIYFSTFTDGVYRKDLKSGKVKVFSAEDLRHTIRGCYLDGYDQLWMNTQEGAVTISKKGEIGFIEKEQGLPINPLSCFFQDADANLWIGSLGKGMFRFPGEGFKYYDKTTEFGADLFLTGFYKSNGDYYFGTFGDGLLKRDSEMNVEKIDIGEGVIWVSLNDVDGKDWFGTQTSLVSIDPLGNIEEFTIEDSVPGKKVTALYRIGEREMYIGGSEGAAHYKNGKITVLKQPDEGYIGTVRDFAMQDGMLYCATNLGLFVYRNGTFEQYHDIYGVIYNIEIDAFSNFWYGSEEGLFRIKDGKNERIELNSNPGSNFINFLNHKNGLLYAGTNNGLFLLSDLNNSEVSKLRFGSGEGIVDLESNLNSGFFDRVGNFWFGTASGLVCYHPKKMKFSTARPKVRLKSILINYEAFDYGDYSESLDEYGFPINLRLPHSKNNLIFELDGISLSNFKDLSYQFWLEGLNEGWSPLSTNSTVTFTSLPAGDYVLKMRSVDVEGRYSDEILVPFTIGEAFYKAWWFIALVLLIIFAAVIVIFRFRLRRVNEINAQEKLGYKARLLSLEQQSMNASMNRHFVFNSLNSIQYFINTQDRLSANKYLTNFANLIRKNLDSATADGNMVTLDEELERLELYLSLESMRFNDRFDYVINCEGVETELIRIPAMIMQPFVENSIIHGILPNTEKKGFIQIDVIIKDNYLLLSIEDNGVGVNHSIKNKVELEGDHRSKGMEITSKRIELLQKVSDNDISLVGPYEIINDDRLINGTRVLLKISLNDLEN